MIAMATGGKNSGAAPAGTPTLHRFFSPSLRKSSASSSGNKKRCSDDAENQVNDEGDQKKRRTFQAVTVSGSSSDPQTRAPLGALSERAAASSSCNTNSSNTATSANPRTSSFQATEASSSSHLIPLARQKHLLLPEQVQGMGLCRVTSNSASEPPPSLIMPRSKVRKLVEGAVLGRNVSSHSPPEILATQVNRVDIEINPSHIGVSRKHLEVVRVNLQEATLSIRQFPRAVNQVAVYRYHRTTDSMGNKPHMLVAGQSVTLHPGDIIMLDHYKKNIGIGGTSPSFLFRVVTMGQAPKRTGTMQANETTTEAQFGDQSSVASEQSPPTKASKPLTRTPVAETAAAAHLSTPVDRDRESLKSGKKQSEEKVCDTPEKDADMNDTPAPVVLESATKVGKDDSNPLIADEVDQMDLDTTLEVAVSPNDNKKKPAKRSSVSPPATRASTKDTTAFGPIIRTPRVNDGFRIQWKIDVPDTMFERRQELPPDWFFARATKVTKKKGVDEDYKLKVKFDTGEIEEYDYPSSYVQILTRDETKSSRYYLEYRKPGSSEIMKHLAYDTEPETLYVGDLVECRYQDGRDHNRWFRGRVAAVNNDESTCEILYYDNEYECEIPIDKKNLRLIERGYENPTWLEQVTVRLPSDIHQAHQYATRTASDKTVLATIVALGEESSSHPGNASPITENSCENVKIKLKLSRGRLELRDYSEVISALFKAARDKTVKMFVWPTSTKKVARSKPRAGRKASAPKSPPPRKNEHKKTKAKKKTSAQDGFSARFRDLTEADLDSPSGYASFGAREFTDDEFDNVEPIANPGPLPSTLFNTSFRGLRSAEPQLGAYMLSHMAFTHGNVPKLNELKQMYEFMKVGPEASGVRYPDPHKMQVASNLVLKFVYSTKMSGDIANSIPSTWKGFEDFLVQINADIYCAGDDQVRTAASSLQRVANSFQVLGCGLELVAALMEAQLSVLDDSALCDSKGYRSLSIVKALRDGGKREVRESLKAVARSMAAMWRRGGHFILTDYLEDDLFEGANTEDNIHCCTTQARRCLNALGVILCYTAWVYCAEEGNGMESKECANVISNVLVDEIESDPVDLSPFFGNKSSKAAFRKVYSKRVRTRIALLLNKPFAKPLQENVAKTLGVSREISFLAC